MVKVQLVYTKNCVYCPSAKQLWKELQNQYNFDYEEVDATTPKGQELVMKFSIMAVPTTIVDNKVEFIGLPSREKIIEKLSKK